MFENLKLCSGYSKDGQKENFDMIEMSIGEVYAIVGNTGSGKSRLIKDIEQMVNEDSITKRKVLLNGVIAPIDERNEMSKDLIAHLSQNMKFVLDITVDEFIKLHSECRGKTIFDNVIEVANDITPEKIIGSDKLNMLSGGQTRALMIADIACICDSKIVLIDEIENAGIDKIASLKILSKRDKLVLIVTHDPHIALMADKRIVMGNGSVLSVAERDEGEAHILAELEKNYYYQMDIQRKMRKGAKL